MYEVYDKPKHITFDLLDKVLAHAYQFLEFPECHIILLFDRLHYPQNATCDYEEGEVTIAISRTLDQKETILSLFHEMVHAKQYIEDKIKFDEYRNTPYIEWPWEKEAYALEQQMWLTFDPESVYIKL